MQEQAQQISEEEQIKINNVLRHAKALLVQIGENTVYYKNNKEILAQLTKRSNTYWYVWLFGAATLYFMFDKNLLLFTLSLFLLFATGNFVYLQKQFQQLKVDRLSEKLDDLAYEYAKYIGDKEEIFVVGNFLEKNKQFYNEFNADTDEFLKWWQDKKYRILNLHFAAELVERKIADDERVTTTKESNDDKEPAIIVLD